MGRTPALELDELLDVVFSAASHDALVHQSFDLGRVATRRSYPRFPPPASWISGFFQKGLSLLEQARDEQ